MRPRWGTTDRGRQEFFLSFFLVPLLSDAFAGLDLSGADTQSELKLSAGAEGTRFVLYEGRPTGESIVSYGPFIGDSSEDIQRLYRDQSEGKMKHISTVSESQRMLL